MLIVLLFLQFGGFPLLHYLLYKSENQSYYIQDFYYESLKMRLEFEKLSQNYTFERLEFLNNILHYESDSILSLKANRDLKTAELAFEFLDSMQVGLKLELLPRPGTGTAGVIKPPEYIFIYKNGEFLKYTFSNYSIGQLIENDIVEQMDFYERELDLSKELGFLDFWISSVSLFNFSEMIPNSILTRLIWLVQSAITFFFLFYLSKLLTNKD